MLLQAKGLTKRYMGVVAVDDVDIHVDEGEILGVIGPNGAGKSTTFAMLAGAVRPTQGEIRFRGENVSGSAPHLMARRGLLRTFQHNMPFAGLSVRENALVGSTRLERTSQLGAILGFRNARVEDASFRVMVDGILAMLGLAGLADADVELLSFGQGRLLEIARALAARPSIILLDEPAAGLTVQETAHLAKIVREISASGAAVLLVEHDMSFLLPLAQRVVVLDRGRKIADGSSDAIRADPVVRAAYLGQRHEQVG